jgi:hypothetical protein
MRKETEDPEPIVDREGDDALLRQALAIIAPLRAIARHKSAAVEIDEHRQLCFARSDVFIFISGTRSS